MDAGDFKSYELYKNSNLGFAWQYLYAGKKEPVKVPFLLKYCAIQESVTFFQCWEGNNVTD